MDGELKPAQQSLLQEDSGNEARVMPEWGMGAAYGETDARFANRIRDTEPFHAAGF